jgi:serine/threonine protein kinase
VFALGVVLYEMTVGRRLFAAASDYDVLDAIANVRVPLPSAVADGYPLELEAIVMRCLARDPARRYASAQALQLDLEHYALRTALRPSSARLGAWVRDVAKLPAMNVELAIVDTPNDATPVFDASAFVEAARVARPVRAPTLRGW